MALFSCYVRTSSVAPPLECVVRAIVPAGPDQQARARVVAWIVTALAAAQMRRRNP